jgi:hypothetical protein
MSRATSSDWRASNLEIVDGEYVRPQPSGKNASAEETIERIAWLMDRSIPIGGIRVGLDPVLGLIPGVGDMVSALISTTLIVQAYRAGVPKSTVLRMMTNVGLDAIVGAIPLVGDVFDFAFKANSRNLALFRASIRGQHKRSSDWGFLTLIIGGIAAMVTIPVAFGIWLLAALF